MNEKEFVLDPNFNPDENIDLSPVIQDPASGLENPPASGVFSGTLDEALAGGYLSSDNIEETFIDNASSFIAADPKSIGDVFPGGNEDRKLTVPEQLLRSLVRDAAKIGVTTPVGAVTKGAFYASSAMEQTTDKLIEMASGTYHPNINLSRKIINAANAKQLASAYETSLYEARRGIKPNAWYNIIASAFGSSAPSFAGAFAGVAPKTLAALEGVQMGSDYFLEQSTKLEQEGESGAAAMPFATFVGIVGKKIAETGGESLISNAVRRSGYKTAEKPLVKKISDILLSPAARKVGKAEAIEEFAQELETMAAEKTQDFITGTDINKSTWTEDAGRAILSAGLGAVVGTAAGEAHYRAGVASLTNKLEPVFEDRAKAKEVATAIVDETVDEMIDTVAAQNRINEHIVDTNPELANHLAQVFEALYKGGAVRFRGLTDDQTRQAGIDWANAMNVWAVMDSAQRGIPLRDHPLNNAIAEIDRIFLEGKTPTEGDLLGIDINNAEVQKVIDTIDDFMMASEEARVQEEQARQIALREADLAAQEAQWRELERNARAALRLEETRKNRELMAQATERLAQIEERLSAIENDRQALESERASSGMIDAKTARAIAEEKEKNAKLSSKSLEVAFPGLTAKEKAALPTFTNKGTKLTEEAWQKIKSLFEPEKLKEITTFPYSGDTATFEQMLRTSLEQGDGWQKGFTYKNIAEVAKDYNFDPALLYQALQIARNEDTKASSAPQTLFQEALDLAEEMERLDNMFPAHEGDTINVDGKERTVFNSEGKRIAQSAEALTNFWKWFGDSKVVDDQGRPLVVYHGTHAANIKSFRLTSYYEGMTDDPRFLRPYAFFSSNKEVAQAFGTELYPLYLRIENPTEIDESGDNWNAIMQIRWFEQTPMSKDGIIIKNIREGNADHLQPATDFIIFDANQAKRTDNLDTFSSEDDRLLHQDAYVSMKGELQGTKLDADAYEGTGEGGVRWGWGNYLLADKKLDKRHYFDAWNKTAVEYAKEKPTDAEEFIIGELAGYLDNMAKPNIETALDRMLAAYRNSRNSAQKHIDDLESQIESALADSPAELRNKIQDYIKLSRDYRKLELDENRLQYAVPAKERIYSKEHREMGLKSLRLLSEINHDNPPSGVMNKVSDLLHYEAVLTAEKENIAAIEGMNIKDLSIHNTAALYRADVPEMDELLDMQKTFDEQPKEVQEKLQKLVEENPSLDLNHVTTQRLEGAIDQLAIDTRKTDTYDWPQHRKEFYNDRYRSFLGRGLYQWARRSKPLAINNLSNAISASVPDTNWENAAVWDAIKTLQSLDSYEPYIEHGLKPKNGEEIYDDLTALLGSQKAASKKLLEYGIKGNTYVGSRDGRGFVIFSGEDAPIQERLYQSVQEEKPEYDPRYLIPKVRGGWTKGKILKYLKGHPSGYGTRSAARLISEFDNVEDLKKHMFWHGGRYPVYNGLKPSITMSEDEAGRRGGGGYGERYWAISLTKDKYTATHFSLGRSVEVHPVVLSKNAKVIERPDLSDSADLENIIVDLYEDGVDAVWIGDKDSGEQELAVINPKAIVNLGTPTGYDMYGLTRDRVDVKGDEQLQFALDRAKEYMNDPDLGPEAIKDDIQFQGKKTTKSTKGADEFRGAYDPLTRAIIFTKISDVSTLFHETAHYWFDRNLRYYRTGLASPEWKDRWEAIMDELGLKPNKRGRYNQEAIKEASEKFARQQEAYLKDGHAANAAMEWAHQDYSQMVGRVYRNLWTKYYGLDGLTPAVKAWFDMNGYDVNNVAASIQATEADNMTAQENTIGNIVAADETKPSQDIPGTDMTVPGTDMIVENPYQGTTAIVPKDPFENGPQRKSKLPKSAERATGVKTDDVTYNSRTMSTPLEAATKLVQTDEARAWDIIKSPELKVDGLFKGDVYRALINKYRTENNPVKIRQVVNAFASSAREAGQAVKSFDLGNREISYESAVDSLGRAYRSKKANAAVKNLVAELKANIHDKAALDKAWAKFKEDTGCK